MRNKCNVCEETDAILHIYMYIYICNFASTRREQIFLKLIYIFKKEIIIK